MGGGLMQLVAYGAQDIYLTGNPQITFFKVVYRRHTNFAVESIEQTFNGQADFGKRITATISRNGDLIQQMYLEVFLPAAGDETNTWTYGVGNALVKQAEIEIGGQLIDRQYGDWMNIWTELTTPEGKRKGYDNMVGNLAKSALQTGNLSSLTKQRLYVPLQFWFNRNPGLALPLIALQYHEVKLNLELRNSADLTQQGQAITAGQTLSCKLYVDYVYLDTDERRRFAQVSHEYLIEQVQFTGSESIETASSNKNVTLNFNHPVKELIWAHLGSDNNTAKRWFNYSGSATDSADSFETALLQLNGHDRFSVRQADYFRKVQNYEHHTRVPRVGSDVAGANNKITVTGLTSDVDTVAETALQNADVVIQYFGEFDDSRRQYIYTYSFALSPEEHQPSGTCNFSRIDNAVLQLKYDSAVQTSLATGDSMTLNIYAVNYNVLRIMSGMGGLAYSN
jgi:hypothetical protein